MRLMNYSRSVGFGVVIAFAACTSTSASKAVAPAAATAATPGSGAQAPAPASPQAPLREPDVIYVPTPDYVVEAMLKMANVTASDVVYDLGSGDGRIPITAARKYGARAVGLDIDPRRIEEARANARAAGVEG